MKSNLPVQNQPSIYILVHVNFGMVLSVYNNLRSAKFRKNQLAKGKYKILKVTGVEEITCD